MQHTISRAGLRYVAAEEIQAFLDESKGHVLGCLGFGSTDPGKPAASVPYAWVDVPTADSGSLYEAWLSPVPVTTEFRNGIRSARNDQVLFGCLEIEDGSGADYDALIYDEYCRVFDFIDELGYPNLIRAWNYVPDIHIDEQALERYKRFSLGRHEAYVAKGRAISRDAPAASAVGKRAGNTVICFLAATRPGVPIENPRQVSAYSYPAQYGPRGPTFSRALFASWNGVPQLYVSGTAAILGHQSQHIGDPGAQTDEIIVNLRAVMIEARGLIDVDAGAEMLFKVYLRKPEYAAMVEPRLRHTFGPLPTIVYLQADICRSELLVEIEVACSTDCR